MRISVPPLRDRIDDIPMLVDHFIRIIAPKLGVEPVPLSHHDIAELQAYSWPGNVRELKNLIERYLLLGKMPGDVLHDHAAVDHNQSDRYPLEWPMAEVERRHSLRVLDSVDGNKSEAARRLGISRKTLERKLNAWNKSSEGQDTAHAKQT